MHHGLSVDVVDGSEETTLHLLFGGDPDVAQHRARELGEEALDEVQPGAVLGGEDELEAAFGLGFEPSSRLLGRVGGMIVEDHPDFGGRRIGRVEELEERDELAGAVAFLDARVDRAGQEIDAGEQAQRTMAFVLVIAGEGRMDAGLGRKVRRGLADRLDAGLLVIGDDRHGLARLACGGGLLQDLDLLVDAQDLRHLHHGTARKNPIHMTSFKESLY